MVYPMALDLFPISTPAFTPAPSLFPGATPPKLAAGRPSIGFCGMDWPDFARAVVRGRGLRVVTPYRGADVVLMPAASNTEPELEHAALVRVSDPSSARSIIAALDLIGRY